MLLAAVGGPQWDSTDANAPRPEQGLLGLRKGLGLYANLRPVRPFSALLDASPLRREIIEGTDMLVVRELTGGIYFGAKERTAERASDLCEYTVPEIERITRTAFEAARSRVTSVDKMNVLETSRLWREVVTRVHSEEFPNVELEHQLVDSAAMKLVVAPRHFDVILTENMFGDILSDEAAMLTGSLGMLPSASLGGDGPGVFEPVHGSAPDIAGTGKANPLAMILSAALMLRHGFAREDAASALESAVDKALDRGLRTARPGWRRDDRRGHHGGPEGDHVNRSGPHLDERRARRPRGREGARTHARAALRHRRLRGRARLRDPARHRDLPPRATTSTGSSTRPGCTTWTSRTPRRRSAPPPTR